MEGFEVKTGDNEELLARRPNIMLGYWNNQEPNGRVVDAYFRLHSEDKARIDMLGHIDITDRIKEILVPSIRDKISPAEIKIGHHHGSVDRAGDGGGRAENLPFPLILNPDYWQEFAPQVIGKFVASVARCHEGH